MGETLRSIYSGIADFVKGIVGNTVMTPVNAVGGGIGALWAGITNPIRNFWNTITTGFSVSAALSVFQFFLPKQYLDIGETIMGHEWRGREEGAMRTKTPSELLIANAKRGLIAGVGVSAITGAGEQVTAQDRGFGGMVGASIVAVGGALVGLNAAGVQLPDFLKFPSTPSTPPPAPTVPVRR